jgi:hypothetical protein
MNKLSSLLFILKNLLVVTVSLSGIVALQFSQIDKQNKRSGIDLYQQQEKQEKFQLNLLNKSPAFGLENIIADWSYLKFIQYFGDSNARESIGYSLSPHYFSAIVDRDPKFVSAILKLDTATSLFAADPQTSVKLLDQSLNSIPSKFLSIPNPPYYLWMFKGINELLFLGKPLSTKQSYSMAVKWAKEYPNEASKRFINSTNQTIKFLEKNPSSKVAQIGSWAALLGNAVDKKTQERAIKEIISLGGEVLINQNGKLNVRVPDYIN